MVAGRRGLLVGDGSWVGMKMEEFEWGREDTFWAGGREISGDDFWGLYVRGYVIFLKGKMVK